MYVCMMELEKEPQGLHYYVVKIAHFHYDRLSNGIMPPWCLAADPECSSILNLSSYVL